MPATLLLLALAAPPAGFDYVAEGLVGLPGSDSRLPWKEAGRVAAATREAAEAAAHREVDERVRKRYPSPYAEERSGRTLQLTPARDLDPTSAVTTITLRVTCLGEYVYEKEVLTILGIPLAHDEKVIRTFPVRLVVSAPDLGERVYPVTIKTPTRGRLAESTARIEAWHGEYGPGEPSREFTVRLLQPNLPDPKQFETPVKPNPADPHDGHFEVGRFTLRLATAGGKLDVLGTPLANAKPPRRAAPDNPRGGEWQFQYYLKQPTTIGYSVTATVRREGDVAAARLAAEAATTAEDEAMRQKLAAAGLTGRVYTATGWGKLKTADGKEGKVRLHPVAVLIGPDAAGLRAFAGRELPKETAGDNVVVAATREVAVAGLAARWKKTAVAGVVVEGEPEFGPYRVPVTVGDRLKQMKKR